MAHRRSLKHFFVDNVGYKVLASLITLILWVSVMGRGDYVVTRVIKLRINTPESYVVQSQSVREIQIKLEGSRNPLLEFSQIREDIPLDINSLRPEVGIQEVSILPSQLSLPTSIKLLSIKPNYLRVELKKK